MSKLKSLPGAENVKFEVNKNKLTLEISLKHRGKVSEKGNARVCSTLGNRAIPGGSGVMIGLNMYVRDEDDD